MTHSALPSQVFVHNAPVCLYRFVSMDHSASDEEPEVALGKLDPDYAEHAWI